VPSRLAASASLLFAKNLFTYLETMISKEGVFAIPMDDELVKATLLTHGGAVVHPAFAKAAAPAAPVEKAAPPKTATESKPAAKKPAAKSADAKPAAKTAAKPAAKKGAK
jgi:H+-translocating NAD(P) transhydrogenase subunit alpha